MTSPATAPDAAAPNTPPAPLAPALAWLADRAAIDDDVRAAVAEAQPDALAAGASNPGPLVDALLAVEKPFEALRVVASALPPREGVWWAWVAARHAMQAAEARTKKAPPAAQVAALAAVERWITQPTDEHRRAAWSLADPAGLDTPAGCAASAVYFSHGSITPPNGPYVPAPAGLHVTMTATAVLLAAMATDAERLREVAGAFTQQGTAVVQRLGGWDAAIVAAKHLFDAQAQQHADASKPPKLPTQE